MTARLLLGVTATIILLASLAAALLAAGHPTHHAAASVPARTIPARASRSWDRFAASQDPTTTSTSTTVVVRVASVHPPGATGTSRPGLTSGPTAPGGWTYWGPRIARCESNGSYTAHNPMSSASGKYEVLDSTWGGYGGYSRAMNAPPAVQEQQAAAMYAQRGTTPWDASRSCWAS